MLISTHKLTKSFAAKTLFRDLTFAINPGERIGLIGPNGAGKSTLLKILAGLESATGGDIASKQGLQIGFLQQSPLFGANETLIGAVLSNVGHLAEWDALKVAREQVARLGLGIFAEDTPVNTLSGGWQKRVALARELAKNPELLLLDEPTNHMDIESIQWLENFLARAPFSVLTITHDRQFLQRVATRMLELDPRHAGGLLSVDGDYLKYLEVREQLILAQENRETVLRNTLRRETQWLKQGAKARTTKQQARIKQAAELEEQVEALTERNRTRTAKIDFAAAEKSPQKLLQAKDLSRAYGDNVLFKGLNLTLGPGTRLGLVGRNGIGKSTLIKTLLGDETPTTGSVWRSDQLTVAYFDQTRQALDPDLPLTQAVCPQGEQVFYKGRAIHIRSYLDRFLFSPLQMGMKIGNLSGGEQSRVLIARLMLTPANLLVLDEPTNDLDMATLNVLENCLQEFNGAIILVTHDRYFLDQVATQILAFPPKESTDRTLVSFADVAQWEGWRPTQKPEAQTKAAIDSPPIPPKKRRLKYNEQRELETMEQTIAAAEQALAEKNAACNLPENSCNAAKLAVLTAEMTELQAKIDQLYLRWDELETLKQ